MIVTLNFFTVLFIISPIPATSKLEPYIVGGKEVKIKQYPHSLFLYMEPNDVEPYVCGGSILTQHILLSVAHCFTGCKDAIITAYAGHENLEEMTTYRDITSFDIHKDYNIYNPKQTHSDIALGYTKIPWQLNKIKRVIIMRKYTPVKEATVAGWGLVNDETGEQQPTLKAVKQRIQPPHICETAGSSFASGMLCAQNYKNYPSHGDSGSAFVLKNGHQIGAVSWRGKKKSDLVVYTNITFYYDWIRQHSRRLQCLNKN